MSDSRWYFTEEQLANSPSRKCGINAEQELSYRQRASNLIQEMGQRLQVSQLCINTAIVYMHRFYAFHSFTLFHRNSIAAAAFFLAAKVEEQPRKLEHVIKILNICLEKNDNTRESYAEQAQELVFNENVLLQTLGFDVAIDHPHTHVVRACQLFNIVTVSRELRQTCYFMASNSLHLTTMCLKYRPTVVAAFCIYIACKWSRWEIPDSSEGKAWYSYVDENVTPDILRKLTDEYLQILDKSPSKFKSKMKAITSNGQAGNTNPSVNRDDGPSTSSAHHKTTHDKHHHHHRSNNNSGSNNNSSSLNNRKDVPKQPQPPPLQIPSGYNKQRPATSSTSSSSSTRPQYQGSEAKPVNEDRTQHRQMLPETSTFTSLPRPIDPHKQRVPAPTTSSSSSQHQQLVTPLPQQRHSLSSKPQIDYHTKPSVKHPSLPQTQITQKKPSWPPMQQPPQQSNLTKPTQPSSSHIQASHSQPTLAPNVSSSSSGRTSSSMSLPSYSESTKAQSQQNDYWFNDKLLDTSSSGAKAEKPSPQRQVKSMFSPSPEHEVTFDRTKMMMAAANIKRNDSPKNEKQERRSSTPSKKSQSDRKPSSGVKAEPVDKKRTFAMMNDGVSEFNPENKMRRVDTAVKTEPSLLSMKQPIETNPDIVKSLLQECYTSTSNKFESFGADSPLDVINPEPINLPLPASEPSVVVVKTENGFVDEDHHKRSKSKKKKDKHKKKKKSHKSDREERKDSSSSSIKISPENILTPGTLKIKIPIKDVNKAELPNPQTVQSIAPPIKLKISKDKIGGFSDSFSNVGDGSAAGASSSSSSSKKKDKDRSKKDKDRKSGSSSSANNNNNNSDFKEASFQQHQQLSVNKINMQQHQQQQQQYQNLFDMTSMFGGNGNSMQQHSQSSFFHQQQQHPPIMNPQQQPFQNFNDFFHNPHVNNYSNNGSSSSKK